MTASRFKRACRGLAVDGLTTVRQFKAIWRSALTFLLFGFVSGNLFGTYLGFFRTYVAWDGLIMMLSLMTIEAWNYLSFAGARRRGRNLNFYKIGLLLGTFVDAFKVGS